MITNWRTSLLALAACTTHHNLGDLHVSDGGAADAAPPTYPAFATTRWAISLGGATSDGAAGAVVDSAGDVIAGGSFGNVVLGSFGDTVDFGDQTVTTANGGAWISKRAGADGHALWTRTFGTSSTSTAGFGALALGPDDSIIAMGGYAGDVTIGAKTFHGPSLGTTSDAFVASYDRTGTVTWVTSFAIDELEGLAVGADGTIAVTGTFHGTLHLPGGDISSGGHEAVAIVVLDPTGNPKWGVAIVDPAMDYLGGDVLAMTAENDIVVTGPLAEPAVLGTTSLATAGGENAFIARFTIAGALLWSHVYGDADHDYLTGPLAITAGGDVAALWNVHTSATGNRYAPDLHVFDPTGNLTGEYLAPGGGASLITAIGSGSGLVSGGSTGAFPVEAGAGPAHGCTFLASEDAHGSILAATFFGSDGPPPGDCVGVAGMSLGPSHTLAIGGGIGQSVDLGTGALRFAGGYGDILIATFDTP